MVILRADGFGTTSESITDNAALGGWSRFSKFVQTNNLHAAVGLRGALMTPDADQQQLDWVKEQSEGGNIEFFDNGYAAVVQYQDRLGLRGLDLLNSDAESQSRDVARSRNLFDKMGLHITTLGLPLDLSASSMSRIATDHPKLSQIFVNTCPSAEIQAAHPGTTWLPMSGVTPEFQRMGDISDTDFLRYKYDPSSGFVVMTIHPVNWVDYDFGKLKAIVDRMRDDGFTFTTPSAYARQCADAARVQRALTAQVEEMEGGSAYSETGRNERVVLAIDPAMDTSYEMEEPEVPSPTHYNYRNSLRRRTRRQLHGESL